MIANIVTWTSTILALGFALLQCSLTLGAPFGEYVLGGKHKILPYKLRIVSGAFSVLFTIAGVMFLQKTGSISTIFHPVPENSLLVIYTFFLGYAIIGNGFLAKSRKEKCVMTPLSVIGFLSSLIVLIC